MKQFAVVALGGGLGINDKNCSHSSCISAQANDQLRTLSNLHMYQCDTVSGIRRWFTQCTAFGTIKCKSGIDDSVLAYLLVKSWR